VRQPNRLVLIGEKMSLASVLRPIAQEVGGEMLLPTGEPSDTMIAELAERAARDDRRTVIFYLSDFDPAGRQMPISVGRKLQAISQRDFPDLEAELHHIAVTLQQVEEYNLPSTPLKETERRADKWRAVMGREQTEIDALLALHEGALHGIIMQAITPFYDAHLQARADEMRFNWLEDANDSLRSHPDYRQRAGDIEEALVDLRVAYKRLEQTQQQLIALNDGHDSGTLTQSEPVIDAVAPEPLFTTRDNYITATKKLRAYRAMEEVS
jgi:hypothetical protein